MWVVNKAALGHAGDVMEQTEDLPGQIILLNCIALVQLKQLFRKDMKQRGGGWILQLSSVSGMSLVCTCLCHHLTTRMRDRAG